MGVNDDIDHDQELEALETLSLTDFPLTDDVNSTLLHGNINPPSPATEDGFEFCSSGSGGFSEEHTMSLAEEMISGGKLIPINDQPNHDQQQQQPPPPPPPPTTTTTQKQTRNKKQVHRRRSESMRELKSSSNKGTASKLVRNSHSLDYKKLSRNSRLNYEQTMENNRNSLSTKTSSSRWSDIVFGPLKVPPEMDLQDIRNRQIVQNTSKSLFPSVENNKDRFAVSSRPVGDHRKTSWGVLGILSCRSSGSVAVTMPLS